MINRMDSISKKRRKVDFDSEASVLPSSDSIDVSSRKPSRLNPRGSISPPTRMRIPSSQAVGFRLDGSSNTTNSSIVGQEPVEEQNAKSIGSGFSSTKNFENSSTSNAKPSPIQLTSVKDLPDNLNIDTVGLTDILGNVLIKECWIFNFLFDVDFVMKQFDEDTRDLVVVKIVHGSWKNEDSNKMRIDEAVKRYTNVQAITAYMPEAYGTHHSKMIVLFRHDDCAQIILLTANMIAGDWRMCQAVWRSPLLPIRKPEEHNATNLNPLLVGSGLRFQHDLLAYLRKYDARTKNLVAQLLQYDFRSVRAALIASVPGKQNLESCNLRNATVWGWPALKDILRCVPSNSSQPHVVIQVSSVASAGDKWIRSTFFDALSTVAAPEKGFHANKTAKFSIVFPTSDEIRRSIDGYSAGGSIHMKTQSVAQSAQLAYLRPMLCHWAGDGQSHGNNLSSTRCIVREAGRRRAPPHIKTYVRFSDDLMTKIDWAMMTSANLSTQAWGAAMNGVGEVRICSYEIGVIVWPALWDENLTGNVEMVPVFKNDKPAIEVEKVLNQKSSDTLKVKVGWRMPYDLPLIPYQDTEMPWCASLPCEEPDWMGRTWPGFGAH